MRLLAGAAMAGRDFAKGGAAGGGGEEVCDGGEDFWSCVRPRRVLADIPAEHFSHQEIAMPLTFISPYLLPILLLLGSNIFMTLAWYGHLRFKEVPLVGVIFAAWAITLVEYCLAV